MEKELLGPVACFPLIFGKEPDLVKNPEFGVELESRLRGLFRETRANELVTMYRETADAIATGALIEQSAKLVGSLLDAPPSTLLVSPLEQTMHAAIAARQQPPRDLAPPVVLARNMAPLCYALYLAVECVRRIPPDQWTMAAAVQFLFGLEQTIESARKEKERVLYGAEGGLPEALDSALPVVRQHTAAVLTTLRRTAPGLDVRLIDAWLKPGAGQAREGMRKKLLDRISELMTTRPEREQDDTEVEEEEEEEEKEDDDDLMDVSERARAAASAQ